MVMGLEGPKGPTVFDAHERVVRAPEEVVGALLDRLGSDDDPIWPSDRWPKLVLDQPLSVGARGGHGPIRYHVVEYEPGHLVRFRFSSPPGFLGHHAFILERAADQGGEAVRLRHIVTMTPVDNARLTWPLVWKPLHDALMEDALDRAESAATGRAIVPRPWPPYVRLLRRLLKGKLARG